MRETFESLYLSFTLFFLPYLLQSMAYVLALYTFNKQKVIKKKYWICTITFLVSTYIFRQLPIHFGVHTLLSLIVLVSLGAFYLVELPTYPTIKATLIATVTLIAIEAINVVALSLILGSEELNVVLENPVRKALAGLPATIAFFLVILISHLVVIKRVQRGKHDAENGKSDS